MKAMVLKQPADVQRQPLVLDDVPVPEPGPDEVRVRVQVCGVCRTDLHIVEGELPPAKRPVVPGHEVVGIVNRVGSRVRTVKVGDRVGIAWLQRTCGTCEFCLDKQENLCLQAQFTGYHVDGGYAEYAVVPADYSYPIPNVFGDEEAAPLLCAGIIGYRALRLSGVKPGQRLGLYGFGASAHIAIQVARHWGCTVYVCSLREEHRTLARELGPAWVGGAPDPHPALQARRREPRAPGLEGRHDQRRRRPHPLTQSSGSRRATLRASLCCARCTQSDTELYLFETACTRINFSLLRINVFFLDSVRSINPRQWMACELPIFLISRLGKIS